MGKGLLIAGGLLAAFWVVSRIGTEPHGLSSNEKAERWLTSQGCTSDQVLRLKTAGEIPVCDKN